MAQITARYKTVEEDYTSGLTQRNAEFEDSLVAVYRAITVFYIKASVYFAGSTLARTWRGIVNADAWTAALEDVSQTDRTCQAFATNLGLSATLQKANELVQRMSQLQSSRHLERIKKWLLFDVDVDTQHTNNKEKLGVRYRQSGRWLIESQEFVKWATESNGQFWIKGAVGTGKTSLVCLIIDHLRDQQKNLGFFYFSQNTLQADRENYGYITRVLRALICQLALSPDDRRVTEEVELRFETAISKGTLRDPEPLVRDQAKDLLVDLINSRDKTTLVLDGLDECVNFTDLLGVLQELDRRTQNLNLLLSSQYVVPVDAYFPLARKAIAGGKESLADMRAFIEGEVKAFEVLRPGLLKKRLSKDIVNTLSEKAEGMLVNFVLCRSFVQILTR